MSLSRTPCLFLDGQTTGMRPPHGQLLEFGFAHGASEDLPPVVISQVFALTSGQLNKKIKEITGLDQEQLEGKPTPEQWFTEFFNPWKEGNKPKLAVIHYAQFELPFLKALTEVDFDVLCTQQLTKKLFPTLPSQNIRAVAGYFGHPLSGPNRAGDFALATAAIWAGIAARLAELGIENVDQLKVWLESEPAPAKRKKTISYRIPADLRLKLPDEPGIYKMLSKDGRVLYVGKATSLKHRVNSYFRGVKNRDRRKLEMLAQVWDLKVEVCGSPLEAAVRETDEIKRFDPPYNVTFKKNQRKLIFYSEDFISGATEQDAIHRRGPFRPGNWIEMTAALHRSIHKQDFEQIFYDPIEPAILKDGFNLFLERHGLTLKAFPTLRSMLAYGLRLFRLYEEPEETGGSDTDQEEEQEIEINADYVAGKFERLLRRTGGELVRSKQLSSLLNAEIEFEWKGSMRNVRIRNGLLHTGTEATHEIKKMPWAGLDIEAYDRLNVLLSELSRLEHRILRQNFRS